MSPKAAKRRSQSDPESDVARPEDLEGQPVNGTAVETEPETFDPAETAPEEPAEMEVKMKGSASAVHAAAAKLGGQHAPRAAAPVVEAELPPEDPTLALLADGRNMVIVTRQLPRTIRSPRGEKFVTNVRIPGKYTCPTSKAEIEDDVFGRHGGLKFKCTIHPDTTNGENTILGHFTIEHPDPDSMPIIEGVTDVEELEIQQQIPMGGDPTLRETDSLAKMKQDLERRLERARMKREMKELEKEVASVEGVDNPKPVAGPTGPDPRDLEIAKLKADLAEKKVNDRFDRLEGLIATALTASKPAEKQGDDPFTKFMLSKMASDDVRFDKLMTALTAKQATPPPAPTVNTFDSTLDMIAKVKGIVAPKEDSSIADFRGQLIQSSLDRLTGGGDDAPAGDEDEQDVVKYGIKQLTPVLKTYVEKMMERESGEGEKISKDRMKEIYAEAAQKAAKDLAAQWAREGLVVATGPDGRPVALPAPKKNVVPARHAGTKVVDERRTPEGVVKTVRVQPTDLSDRARPAATSSGEPAKEGDSVTKFAELPKIGEGGGVLKIELPAPPGDIKYDRKRAVNFILDSIRSEIAQRIPHDKPNDSFVPGDALELLDDEVLARISRAENGADVEGIFAEWGDRAKVDEIKTSGADEAVKVWLRRLITTVGDTFRDTKAS